MTDAKHSPEQMHANRSVANPGVRRYLEREMTDKYRKSDTTLFIMKIMLGMKKMKAELERHRYSLERNVKLETEFLLKRVAVLESCNAALSAKLAEAHREIAELKRQAASGLQAGGVKHEERAAKLYAMNKRAHKKAGLGMQGKWNWHAVLPSGAARLRN